MPKGWSEKNHLPSWHAEASSVFEQVDEELDSLAKSAVLSAANLGAKCIIVITQTGSGKTATTACLSRSGLRVPSQRFLAFSLSRFLAFSLSGFLAFLCVMIILAALALNAYFSRVTLPRLLACGPATLFRFFLSSLAVARAIARHKPNLPVMAFCFDKAVARRLQLHRAIHPVLIHNPLDQTVYTENSRMGPLRVEALRTAKESGWVSPCMSLP